MTRALVVALAALACVVGPAVPAAAEPTPAGPDTAAGWQQLYDGLPYRGDGMFSAGLPDGRSAWVTGDAIPRAGGTWASNTVTVVNGTGSWQTPNVLPDADGVVSWLGPAAVVGGKLVVLVSRIGRTPGVGLGFDPVGTGIATMRLGAGEWWPTVEEVTRTPWSASSVNWTAGIWPGADCYVYVFGTRQKSGTAEFDVYLARVPATSLHVWSAWRFWRAGRWTLSPSPVLTGGTDPAFSVRKTSAGWHLYTRHAGAHGEWVGGPTMGWRWCPRGTEAGYLPSSHPEVRLASGGLLVTVNGEGGARFLEVPR